MFSQGKGVDREDSDLRKVETWEFGWSDEKHIFQIEFLGHVATLKVFGISRGTRVCVKLHDTLRDITLKGLSSRTRQPLHKRPNYGEDSPPLPPKPPARGSTGSLPHYRPHPVIARLGITSRV